MAGNGVGDRAHNSFDQENFSQGAVDKNWPGLSNSVWVGSQTRSALPLSSSPNNYSVPQSTNIDSGRGIPYFQAVNGLNSGQPNIRFEVAGNQFLSQHSGLNGFMQGHRAAKQYEANLLGMGADSYQNTVAPEGLSLVESHHGNGTDFQKKDYGKLSNIQPSSSFSTFSGQEQMGGQHPGMVQALQRQQSGISDMQLMQQHMDLRQLQDYQRQSFLHQGVLPQNSPINFLSSMASQAAANHSPALLNGIPVHDSLNKPWPELLSSNSNRQNLSASAIMQGSSNEFELSSKQSQAPCTKDLVLQQYDQSLYGVPLSGTRNSMNRNSQVRSENPTLQQISSFGNAFSRSQHIASDHATKDGPLLSRQVGSPSCHNSIGGFESCNLQQLPPSQRNVALQNVSGNLELGRSSDAAQEKTSSAAVHSQNVASLDPSEEKILFGSDGNLWEAFGGEMNTGLGGLNIPEGSGLFGGFPSLQSGSWSALMLSALAETSSIETGQQEEWSGLSFQSAEPNTGNQQPVTCNNGVKQEQQSAWSKRNMQAGSNIVDALGNQLNHRASHERIENMHSNCSPRYIEDSSEENKHLKPSLLASPSESVQICGNADNSSMADRKQHTSGSWTHQQSMSSFDACARLNNRVNGWNATGKGSNLRYHSDEMVQQLSKSSSQSKQGHEVLGGTAGKTDTFHGLSVGANKLNPLGSSMLHRHDSSSNAADNSSSSKALLESTHWLQNSQSLNVWGQADPSPIFRGSDRWGGGHHLGKGSKGLESDNNNVPEQQNCRRESSSGFLSNVSSHASPGLLQENACIDGSDSHSLHDSMEDPSGQAAWEPVRVQKFQYHRMGDLNVDMDNFCGTKGGLYPHAATKQIFNKSSPVGVSSGSLSLNDSAQPSQNMLELLHKLDQSKAGKAASHFRSSGRNDAHEPENSDGSVGQLQCNQSTGSQGCGLQLAPPSQQLQNLDHVLLSQGCSSQVPSSQISSNKSEIGHMPFVSAPSVRSSWNEPCGGGKRELTMGSAEQMDDRFSMGFTSGFPFSRSHLQHDTERALPGQSVNPTLHMLASYSNAGENTSGGTLPSQSALHSVADFSASTSKGSGLFAAEGAQSGMHAHAVIPSSNSPILGSASMSQPSLTPHILQQSVYSRGLSTTIPGSTAPALLKPLVQSHNNDLLKGVGGVVELSASVSFKPPDSCRTDEAAQSTLQGKVSSINHVSHESLPRSVPDSVSHQSYSLLHQMQSMKSSEVDPSQRASKRFRVPDSGVNSGRVHLGGNHLSLGHNATAGYAYNCGPGVDTRVLNLSGKQGDNCDTSSASWHMDALRQSDSPHSSCNSEASLRHDNSQMNSQMAASWVGQSGILMNGQALQGLDAQRMTVVKHIDQARLVQEPADCLLVHEPLNQYHHVSGASPIESGYSRLPASVGADNILSKNLLPPEVTDQSLLSKQKKRRVPATEVQAWHKEVMTNTRLQSTSITEIEWARAANQMVQKMEDGGETNKDGLPSPRPKKRLILTTQLMQQLLQPPPAPFLAGDSRSHYENVTYCVSKSALGDACDAIDFSCNNSSKTNNSSGKISLLEKAKTSERSDSGDTAKVVANLVDRTKMLENELLRLDRRYSIVDLRVELQDLDRFSIFNRFAKFQGRSQFSGSGASPPDFFAYRSRTAAQRCVTANPAVMDLPDSVQCLSL